MLSAVTLASVVVLGGFIINPSPSAPVGIWKLDRGNRDIAIGEYVFVCPPAHPVLSEFVRERLLLAGHCDSETTPFIKKVYATSGQALDAHPEHGLFIDGVLVPDTLPYNWPGLEFTTGQVVKRGEFVALQTDHVASIDSRYFGPLKTASVIGKIRPVWVK